MLYPDSTVINSWKVFAREYDVYEAVQLYISPVNEHQQYYTIIKLLST